MSEQLANGKGETAGGPSPNPPLKGDCVDWEFLKDSLSQFSTQRLKVDGYDISLRLEKVSMLELVIAVYVNGAIKGKWLMRDDKEGKDICRRFLWKRDRYVYGKDTRDIWVESFGKRKAKKEGMFDRVNYWSAYFKSFETLKRTFQDNNDHMVWINSKHKIEQNGKR